MAGVRRFGRRLREFLQLSTLLRPRRARAGSHINPHGVSLQLVNLHSTESRNVVVQGGAFGEHRITRVRQVVHYPFQFHTVDNKFFVVRLGPGAVGKLEIGLKRFANRPSYAFPWHGDTIP